MKYRILDNSGLAFAEYLGLLCGVELEWTGQRHHITNQMIFRQPSGRGVVMLDDAHVEFIGSKALWLEAIGF